MKNHPRFSNSYLLEKTSDNYGYHFGALRVCVCVCVILEIYLYITPAVG